MKKLLTLLLCFVAATLSYADPISEQEAYQIAQQFMQGKLKTVSKTSAKLKAKRVAAAQKNLYIFNAESNGGFVIVSGDDRAPSILGYSDRGEIDMENLPCNVKWLLDSYDSAIASLDDSSDATAATTASATRTAIEPLLDTQWGQGSPYNSLCPTIDSEQCVTGCVATAMAQIVNYNRWPQGETATVAAYTTSTNSISMSALPATTFDWNNMGSAAIARLMLYCGQSVSMDYGAGGSSAAAADVATALTDVFGYSKSASYKAHSNFTDDEWNDMIYAELSESRPVLFGGQSSTGGHAFVVDGCDSEGQFHVNWGWSGYCDGYFTLDGLNPTSNDGYNSRQEIVCSIAPPADASDITRPKAIVTKMTTSSSYLERASASADFAALTVGSTLQSDMSETATLQIGLALYDDNGLVKVLSSGNHEFTTTESYTYEVSVTIGSDIPQGEYRLVAVNRSGDSDEWLTDLGSSDEYISVTVGETGLTLQTVSKSGSSSTIDFGVHTIDGVTYQLTYNSSYTISYRAKVLNYHETEKYSGVCYIPDNVSYQNISFSVAEHDAKIFQYCPELTSVSIPFGTGFLKCDKLSKIEFREGVSSTGGSGIYYCNALEYITYPKSCSEISIPNMCDKLKAITFLNDDKRIKIRAFSEEYLSKDMMPSLTDIYFTTGIPPVFSDETPNVNTDIKIHIPMGSKEYYNSIWKDWTLVEDQPATKIKKIFPRKIVMEEATGTWCVWCPRGIVSIEELYDEYPDNFIAICVHDDAMMPATDSYNAYFEQISGYPSSFINRTEWMDPSSWKVEKTIKETKDLAVVTIAATAMFCEDVENAVKVNTETIFGFDDDGTDTEYRIAYVLVEDSVGPYKQSNYYSGATAGSDEKWNWWYSQGSSVEILFNNVARKIYDDYYGVEGQLPSVIKNGETYKSSYTLTLPDNVQNAKNLKVVALLLDTSTGEILNADRTAISGEVLSGIGAINNGNSTTSDVYNLMGMKVRAGASSLNGLPQGVYIVNGKKIAVR